MGLRSIDYFSISHFVGGMILQRMGLSRITSYSLHVFHELFENIEEVVRIRRCISIPYILPVVDCKTEPDSVVNMISDQIFFMLGFEVANIISLKYIPVLPKYSRIFIPILALILSLMTVNIGRLILYIKHQIMKTCSAKWWARASVKKTSN